MKTTSFIGVFVFAVVLSLVATVAMAQTVPVRPPNPLSANIPPVGRLPGGDFVPVASTYSKVFALDTVGITWNSCYVQANYEKGACDYLGKCYIILPEGCTELACARGSFCADIVDLQPTEPITATFTPTTADINKNFAVAAFIMKASMTYDFSAQKWNNVTTIIDSTKQSDIIQVQGAPAPPATDWLAGISDKLAGLVAGIRSWLCANFGVWC